MKTNNFISFIILLIIFVGCNLGETYPPELKITLLNESETGWHETEINYKIEIFSNLPPYRLIVETEEAGLNNTGNLDTLIYTNVINYKYIIDNSNNGSEHSMSIKFIVFQSDNKSDTTIRSIRIYSIEHMPEYTERFNLTLFPINIAQENKDCYLSMYSTKTITEAINNSEEIILGYYWSDSTGCLIASPNSAFLQSIQNGSANWTYKNSYRFMFLDYAYFDLIECDNYINAIETLQNLNFNNISSFDTLKNIQIDDEIALNFNNTEVNGLIKIEDFNLSDKSLTLSILLCIEHI